MKAVILSDREYLKFEKGELVLVKVNIFTEKNHLLPSIVQVVNKDNTKQSFASITWAGYNVLDTQNQYDEIIVRKPTDNEMQAMINN